VSGKPHRLNGTKLWYCKTIEPQLFYTKVYFDIDRQWPIVTLLTFVLYGTLLLGLNRHYTYIVPKRNKCIRYIRLDVRARQTDVRCQTCING